MCQPSFDTIVNQIKKAIAKVGLSLQLGSSQIRPHNVCNKGAIPKIFYGITDMAVK